MGEESRDTRSDVQTDRDLFKATLPFGVESVKTSWWVVGSTFLCRPRTRVANTSVVLHFVGPFRDARLHHVPRLYAQRDFVAVPTCALVVLPLRCILADATAIVEEQPQFSPWSCR